MFCPRVWCASVTSASSLTADVAAMLALCRSLLGPPLALAPHLSTQQLCPLCSSAMVLVERLTAYQLDFRSTSTTLQATKTLGQLVISHDSLRFDQRPQSPCSRTQRRPMLVLLPHLAKGAQAASPLPRSSSTRTIDIPLSSPPSRKNKDDPSTSPSKSHRQARIHRASGSLQTTLP